MIKNFVEETCTGTGNTLTLLGSTVNNLGFSSSFNDGDSVDYSVLDSGGIIKCTGKGIFNKVANTFTRNDSWNYDGAIVNINPTTNITLSGGTHRIICTVTAENIETITDFSALITATTVDVFVYNTAEDSDGGAWRKKTQNTSWYNEALNTATRGATREFPAIAVIVAEAGKVTIYTIFMVATQYVQWYIISRASGTRFTRNKFYI